MREPEWVYRQRRQRAAVAVAMAVGAIAMLIVFGPTLSGGFDLDGPSRIALDRPDPDEILAREQREIDAAKQRKLERHEARAERRARPKRKPKPAKKPKNAPAPATGGAPAPASTPAPSPPPAAPDPSTAQAPPAPQPSQPSSGAVDPRFY